jgi:hypothetical protein
MREGFTRYPHIRDYEEQIVPPPDLGSGNRAWREHPEVARSSGLGSCLTPRGSGKSTNRNQRSPLRMPAITLSRTPKGRVRPSSVLKYEQSVKSPKRRSVQKPSVTCVTDGVMLSHSALKPIARDQLENLSEGAAYSFHGEAPLTGVNLFLRN